MKFIKLLAFVSINNAQEAVEWGLNHPLEDRVYGCSSDSECQNGDEVLKCA